MHKPEFAAAILLLNLGLTLSLKAPGGNSLPQGSSRISGVQPRGNAVLRDARRTKQHIVVDSPRQTDRLRAAAMEEFGLNVNDYWTLRSGTIAEALPNSSETKAEVVERLQRAAAKEAEDRKRLEAEQRLQQCVRSPGGGARLGDTRVPGRRPSEQRTYARAPGSNARAAARLCMAMAEARRRGCHLPQLLQQAEALHALLEHAAAEEYTRSQQEQEQPLADAEDSRRNALVHKLALDWGAHPGE